MFSVCLLNDDLEVIREIKRFYHPIDAKKYIRQFDGYNLAIRYLGNGY
jgi:hypothetical protein